MKLGILDQAPVSEAMTEEGAARFAVDLAKKGEEWGYSRIWYAEHHNTHLYASPSPELIAAAAIGQTEKIHVGTGGIMLMHYSPYKMAENVKLLSALSSGRFDFGAGRAPGGDHDSTYALATSKAPDFSDQYEKFDDTLKLIAGREEETSQRRFQDVIAAPALENLPEAWLLGSSGNSAVQAGRQGVGYSFAQFFARDAIDKEFFDAYRQAFEPSDFLAEPQVMGAYLVTVAETEEEAIARAIPQDIVFIGQASGQTFQMPSTERARQMDLSDDVKAAIQLNRSRHFVGTAEQVAEKLYAEQKKYGFDELMICSNQAEYDSRLDSYRLLAEVML